MANCKEHSQTKTIRESLTSVAGLGAGVYGAYWYHDRKKKRKEDSKWYGYAFAFLTLAGLGTAVARLGTDLPFVAQDAECGILPDDLEMRLDEHSSTTKRLEEKNIPRT